MKLLLAGVFSLPLGRLSSIHCHKRIYNTWQSSTHFFVPNEDFSPFSAPCPTFGMLLLQVQWVLRSRRRIFHPQLKHFQIFKLSQWLSIYLYIVTWAFSHTDGHTFCLIAAGGQSFSMVNPFWLLVFFVSLYSQKEKSSNTQEVNLRLLITVTNQFYRITQINRDTFPNNPGQRQITQLL